MKLIQLKHVQVAHEEGVWAVAWVPATDARPALVLTGSVDEKVKTWSGDDLQPLHTSAGHQLGVVGLAASPLGNIAASSSLDSIVRVFDIDTNATKQVLECPPAESWQIAFSPDGSMLAVAGGSSGSVKLWNLDESGALQLSSASLEVPRPEKGARDGGAGAGGAERGAAEKGGLGGSGKFVLSVAWSADGRRLAAGTMDGTVAVWDVGRRALLHTLEGHNMPVRALAFSPTEPRILYTGSDDAHIHVYDAEARTLAGSMSGHSSWVLSVAAAPGGLALATGSSDKTVRLWDLRMRAAVQQMSTHTDQVWGVAFQPSSGEQSRLVSVSDDRGIVLYDYL